MMSLLFFSCIHPESFKTHINDVWHEPVIHHEMVLCLSSSQEDSVVLSSSNLLFHNLFLSIAKEKSERKQPTKLCTSCVPLIKIRSQKSLKMTDFRKTK